MGLYRGQDMGGRRQLSRACLEILERGIPDEIYDILPHVRILRSDSFLSPLLALLEDDDSTRQRAALAALGGLGAAECVEAVCRLLDGQSADVEEEAIRALGDIGDETAVEPLAILLSSRDDPDRRAWIVAALGKLAQQGSLRAEHHLAGLVDDPDPQLRAQVASELAIAYWHRPQDIPESILERVIGLASDESGMVQQAALSALTNLSDLGSEPARRFLEHGQDQESS